MTYHVLARQWRPQDFEHIIGQEHVVSVLRHALQQNRLHHAYLFTGTRGTGKTTLARVFAKALNCERGISDHPCNECSSCLAITQVRSIDVLEIDGASHTRVEDVRTLLDNSVYPPAQSRYKIYLIDEVHMLSTHSFNALLKTLEEPPAHLIFLFATTDPQKLLPTVLSRCLRFHLNHLNVDAIAQQMDMIVQKESVVLEADALQHIAYLAEGSLRDALSMLEQALTLDDHQVTATQVRQFFGGTDPEEILDLIDALAQHNGQKIHDIAQQWMQYGVNFDHALQDLLNALYKLSFLQTLPNVNTPFATERLQKIASQLSLEDVQLWYQIALTGRHDLPLAPTPALGFNMLLLRMLAFKPATQTAEAPTTLRKATANPKISPPMPQAKPATQAPPTPQAQAKPQTKPRPRTTPTPQETNKTPASSTSWGHLLSQLALSGIAKILATHCTLKEQTEKIIALNLEKKYTTLLTPNAQQRLQDALRQHFNNTITLIVTPSEQILDSPARQDYTKKVQEQEQTKHIIEQDPNAVELMKEFNATIVEDPILSNAS